MGNFMVWIPDEIHARFRYVTKKKGMSMGNEIRKLIMRWLEENDDETA